MSKTTKALLSAAVIGSIAAAGVGLSTEAEAAKKKKEKCYGVVKAGHNDCGSLDKSHSCAAQAKTDADIKEWVYLPKGICERLVGGMTKEQAEKALKG